ncbi:D-isomer specific 2-hydroxyacid dehydrogenase family protein [Aspergillus melleus]|uniref:D-isomer specific 2-hydroxyacid dehydrogenase family protein n=1 Tax=Aspergillus melleus TaxID=138277 RepID=UPI001E8D2A9E|nr:uncharacterized protein LDX57_004041 [Aspergillus melleus]KAH8426294.1 hypothetical protein LDX57_004041 [Aspergillus melleus]
MTNHHIVYLQADFINVPEYELAAPNTYTQAIYPQTSPADLHARIHDATILAFSRLHIDAISLSPEVTPHLKLIVVVATGTDCVDLEACKKRGIAVSNCPSANFEAVSEHAIGMYFATRRKMLPLHSLTRDGQWPRQSTLMYQALDRDGAPPLTCQEEVVGLIGNGTVGKRLAELARGLGMKVLVSGRKELGNHTTLNGVGGIERTSFETVIRQSTVIFLAVPLTESTRDLISTKELEAMSHRTLVINVSRGGVVNEEALVKALKEGQIAGAATDVFSEEPAGPKNSPLLRPDTQNLNLLVTPHLAWLAQKTVDNQSRMLKEALEGWVSGARCNVVL